MSYQDIELLAGDVFPPPSTEAVVGNEDGDEQNYEDEPGNSKPPATRASRKRTKSGCLTCRKRRIKCGEERPTCNNCVKSKRVCEGYNQRVVFKVGQFRNPSFAGDGDGRIGMQESGVFDPSAALAATGGYSPDPRYTYSAQPTRGPPLLQPIAPAPYPRRDETYQHELPPHLRQHYAEQQQLQQQQQLALLTASDPSLIYHQAPFDSNEPIFPTNINTNVPHSSAFPNVVSYQNPNYGPLNPPQIPSNSSNEPVVDYSQYNLNQSFTTYVPSSIVSSSQAAPSRDSSSTLSPATFEQSMYPPSRRVSSVHPVSLRQLSQTSSSSGLSSTTNARPYPLPTSNIDNNQQPRQNSVLSAQAEFNPYSSTTPNNFNAYPGSNVATFPSNDGFNDQNDQKYEQTPQHQNQATAQTHVKAEKSNSSASYGSSSFRDSDLHERDHIFNSDSESEDDEFEEMDTDIMPRAALSSFLAPHAQAAGRQVSYRSFLPESGELAKYVPSAASSPLMNPTTARIFCHWVYVVAPGISIFERDPPNPQVAFTPGAGNNGPQNVWTYSIPMLSLSSSLLLHALLAVSSLHIAKVANESLAPAHIHYHLALRRLRKALEDDKERAKVATLAATLLLGYYETMSADVHKWSSHVQGAKNLLREIDFDHVTNRVLNLDDDMQYQQEPRDDLPTTEQINARINEKKARRKAATTNQANNAVTKYLLGSRGQKSSSSGKKPNINAKRDLDTCLIQSDLFWWFAKMDCYQAVLSASKLTLDYAFWGQCPPRSHIGTLGTSYGSSDHLILLYGRIADFAYRDQTRKREVEKYGPAPAVLEMMPSMSKGPGGPSGMRGPPSDSGIGRDPQGPPNMQGPPRPSMPSNPEGNPPDPNYNTADMSKEDLEAATIEAEQEWIEISQALQLFQESLNEEFQPIDEDSMPALSSPFGNAIYFRTYSIASMQLLFKCAQIILERCHPSMPPNPMIAAGIAARKTAHRAYEICRISAGLLPPLDIHDVSPSLGGALVELTFCLLFAGVQCQDPIQRDWLVDHLRHVAETTGWGTANRVVAGCQHAWMKMAEAGKGQPYTKPEVSLTREGVISNDGDSDHQYIWRSNASRAHWAIGVLGEQMASIHIENAD